MSFDLIAWDALQHPPTTLDEADQRDEELSAAFNLPRAPVGEEWAPSAKMSNLADQFELLIREMPFEGESRVWSSKPAVGRDFAVLTFAWPAAQKALQVTRRLCPELNVTCYDPQDRKLYRPGGGSETDDGQAVRPDGTIICRPADAVLEDLVRAVSPASWFLTLDLGARYIQVGFGKNAGAPDGAFSLECRESEDSDRRRIQVQDLGICAGAFLAFRRDDPVWQTYFAAN